MTLGDYASRVNGTIVGDPATPIAGISAIDEAGAGSLTFATDDRYLRAALASRASAVLVDAALVPGPSPARKPLLLVPSARAALAQLLAALESPPPPERHPSAVVDPTAEIAPGAGIGALAIVGARAVVGAGARIGAGAQVGAGARVGEGAILHARALLLERCIAGDRTILHPGAVVGSDGFGFVFLDGRLRRIPQVGNVVLGDDVEIGANSCIDRAQTGSTTIGNGTKIDNLVQIGHNCRIGHDTAFAAMSGVAGSTTIGDYVQVGAQVGIQGHVAIGSRVRIGGGSKVWGAVPDGAQISGTPAQDHRAELRRQARLRSLETLEARVRALEQA